MDDPAPAREREGPAGPWLRRAGLLVLLLAGLLPCHGCRAHPGEYADPPRKGADCSREHGGNRGGIHVEAAVRLLLTGESVRVEDLLLRSDGKSDDLPGPLVFLALPVWAAALRLVRGDRPRTRGAAGLLLWLGIAAVFAGAAWNAIEGDFRPDEPPFLGNGPAAAVLAVAGLLLALRPRDRWRLEDGHTLPAVLRAQWINHRAGFWLALAGLALEALPLYLSGMRPGRLYDRPRPWRYPSSTPTPTSTSRSSTGTATPSSTGPAPPGS